MTRHDEFEIDLYPWADEIRSKHVRAHRMFLAGISLAFICVAVLAFVLIR